MNIDEQIIAKQKEMKINHDWLATHPLEYDQVSTDPHPTLPQHELNEHIMHVKIDELLEVEYELLLDEKYPNAFQPDRSAALARVTSIKAEIETIKSKI